MFLKEHLSLLHEWLASQMFCHDILCRVFIHEGEGFLWHWVLPDRGERLTVERAGAMLAQRGQMTWSAVSLV